MHAQLTCDLHAYGAASTGAQHLLDGFTFQICLASAHAYLLTVCKGSEHASMPATLLNYIRSRRIYNRVCDTGIIVMYSALPALFRLITPGPIYRRRRRRHDHDQLLAHLVRVHLAGKGGVAHDV